MSLRTEASRIENEECDAVLGPQSLFGKLYKFDCENPVYFVSQRLKRLLAGTQTALGTVQIMVGLLNIGLGALVLSVNDSYLFWISAPYWLGGLFITAGLMSMLGERFPSPCLVFLTALMNLASACLAITAIVLYSVDLARGPTFSWQCSSYEPEISTPRPERYYYRYRPWRSTAPPEDPALRSLLRRSNFDICQNFRGILMVMLGGIDVLLIIFAVLQLCVTIAATALGVKALCKNRTEEKLNPDPEVFKPLVEEDTTDL
ncbi:hypothetical protein GJAV_G00008880 [Gymnothorax javanicus]|nr:hypothetical protein GJAV_G00008880 [Gymnothorax javanicus]